MDDVRMAALRVLRKHCESDEQFLEELQMLGLDDLATT